MWLGLGMVSHPVVCLNWEGNITTIQVRFRKKVYG